ncbi:MAG: YqaJ viral recombinase family protein [Bryobacteraceae bacterium]
MNELLRIGTSEMIVLHNGQDREAWIKSRNQGVGASEVAMLFDCGYSESSKLDLYARKIETEGLPPFEETEPILWGKLLEDAIICELAKRAELGAESEGWQRNKCLLGNAAYPHLIATPDGMTSDCEPIEVKNICHMPHKEEWNDGEIPLKYQLQLQTQMAVMGATRGIFGALMFGGRLVWNWFDRDDVLIAEIRNRAIDFWGHVERREPPESNGSKSAHDAAFALSSTIPPVEFFHGEIEQYLLDWEAGKEEEKLANAAAKKAKAKHCAAADALTLKMGSARHAITTTGWAFEKSIKERAGFYVNPSRTEKLNIEPPKGLR